jgi:hypothetical protein
MIVIEQIITEENIIGEMIDSNEDNRFKKYIRDAESRLIRFLSEKTHLYTEEEHEENEGKLPHNIIIYVDDKYPIKAEYHGSGQPYEFGDYSLTKAIMFVYNGDDSEQRLFIWAEKNGRVNISIKGENFDIDDISVPIKYARILLITLDKMLRNQARETRVEYGPLAHSAAAARKSRKSRKARKN